MTNSCSANVSIKDMKLSNTVLILLVFCGTVLGSVQRQLFLPRGTIEKRFNQTTTTSTEPPQLHQSAPSLDNDPITDDSPSASTDLSSSIHDF